MCTITAESERGNTYLQQEWLQFAIQDDVKAKDLKAGATSHVIREARPVVVLDDWMSWYEGLDDDIIDVSPDLVYVIAVQSHPFVDGRDASEEGHDRWLDFIRIS